MILNYKIEKLKLKEVYYRVGDFSRYKKQFFILLLYQYTVEARNKKLSHSRDRY